MTATRLVRMLAVLAITLHACSVDVEEVVCLSAGDCGGGQLCVDFRCVAGTAAQSCPGAPPEGEPGGDCGECANGVWSCSQGSWKCLGDTVNACGGCSAAPGGVGEACGLCGGLWDCSDGDFVCAGDTRNACGGCTVLVPSEAAPGRACDRDTSAALPDGVWTCAGADVITCTAPALNACGGMSELEYIPGEPCGPCNEGSWTCTGTDAVDCCYGSVDACGDAAARLDACGSCGAIPNVVGDACGVCGNGTWQLNCTLGLLQCRDQSTNSCGGCDELSGQPGETCGEGAVFVCSGPDEVVCAQHVAANVCGGTISLAGRPGDVCGECAQGRLICAGPDRLSCVGDVETSECGTCAALPSAPNVRCGATGSLQCTEAPVAPGDALLTCAAPPGLDACGGTSEAPQLPLDDCGSCGGIWGCAADASFVCVVEASRRPRTLYVDSDGDGYGDADDVGVAMCGGTEGFAESPDDCDDDDEDVNPGAVDVPGNSVDEDCDPLTPE